jgi:hypothetical protein
MIEISTDNNLIYAVLEKADALPLRFDIDNVFTVDEDEFFYVMIYLSGNRNFISFRTKDYLHDNNALIYLQQVVENYDEKEIPVNLVDEALQLIEHKMHTKKNNRYFFDAH